MASTGSGHLAAIGFCAGRFPEPGGAFTRLCSGGEVALEPLIGTHEDYRKLAEAIDKTLGDLQSRAELDIVNEVVARYTDLMEPIKPPLSTAEGERLRSEMLKLKKSVAEAQSGAARKMAPSVESAVKQAKQKSTAQKKKTG